MKELSLQKTIIQVKVLRIWPSSQETPGEDGAYSASLYTVKLDVLVVATVHPSIRDSSAKAATTAVVPVAPAACSISS